MIDRSIARGLLALALTSTSAALHAQCPDGSPPPCRSQASSARTPVSRSASTSDRTPSLAVLYVRPTSRDTIDVAVAEGLTEEIIARLSQVRGLNVTSRYATVRYRGREASDPRVIGRDLGVRYVLQGSMRRLGERVRIVFEITDASVGYNVWGQSFDKTVPTLVDSQDAIASQVVASVRDRLVDQRARVTLASADVGDQSAEQQSAATPACAGVIEGKVSVGGAGVAGASVILEDPSQQNASAPATTRTDASGDYHFGVTGACAFCTVSVVLPEKLTLTVLPVEVRRAPLKCDEVVRADWTLERKAQ